MQPYKCQFCVLKFSDLTSKSKHERTHTKLKPYTCQICEKSFGYSNVLKAHLKSHDNERNFSCEVCARRFSLKCNMEVHLRGHLRRQNIGMDLKKAMQDLVNADGSFNEGVKRTRGLRCRVDELRQRYDTTKLEVMGLQASNQVPSHETRRLEVVHGAVKHEKELLGSLFVETDAPQILPCTVMPSAAPTHGAFQVQIFNLPNVALNNPNQPLKVFIANL